MSLNLGMLDADPNENKPYNPFARCVYDAMIPLYDMVDFAPDNIGMDVADIVLRLIASLSAIALEVMRNRYGRDDVARLNEQQRIRDEARKQRRRLTYEEEKALWK